LIFAFCNGSGLMILLGAEFLAMMLIIVYVGAVAILFLFVIMMLDINFIKTVTQFKTNLLISITVALIMFADLVTIIWLSTKNIVADNSKFSPQLEVVLMSRTNTHSIGQVLYTDFILPFQISGIILFVAMISCITLTLRHRLGVKKQDIAKQKARNKDNSILIAKPNLHEGVEGIAYD
jgi:NADH-quinone oxidoreductase subunit J